MYDHRDPPDGPNHPAVPKPEKRLADQQEKLPWQSTYISCMRWMDGWMLFNDTSAQFRPFGVLERLEIKPFLLYEITLAVTQYFRKDTSMLIKKWSDSMQDTEIPLIKQSLSREITRSKKWPCLCVISCPCCLRLADLRMSANCLVSALLWQSQWILKSPKINRWPMLVNKFQTFLE